MPESRRAFAVGVLLVAWAGVGRSQDHDPPQPEATGRSWAVELQRGGRPAAGLLVRVWRRGLEGGAPLGEWRTDADGWAQVAGIPPGPCTVAVQDGAEWVVLGPRMHLDLERLRRVGGRVCDATGAGLAQAEVTLQVGALLAARAQANAEGRWTLRCAPDLAESAARADDPPLDAPRLIAWAPGHVPAHGTLGGGELRLRRGESGGLRGRVMGPDGLALTGVAVRLLRGDKGEEQAGTDGLGWFTFPRLEAGVVTLEVIGRSGGIPSLRADARVLPDETAEVQLRVPAPARLVVLVREGDQPLAGCQVQLIDPGVTRFGGFAASQAQPAAETDPQGVVTFEALPPGRYFLRASPGGRAAPLLSEVDLRPGGAQRVIMEATSGRKLEVRVVDAQGVGVPNVFMDVSMPGINWTHMPSSTTGPDGVGTFFDLPPGRAEVHLGRGGLWRMVQAEGSAATFVWSEARTVHLRGRLTNYRGPLLVACALPDVVHMTKTVVGADGALDLEVTPPDGDLRVFLLAHDRRLAPIDLGRVDGIEPGFAVGFAPGARVSGRMVDRETGNGVAGRVRLVGIQGGVLEAQRQWLGGTDHDEWITINEWADASGPDGLFGLEGLAPGTAILRLEAVGSLPRDLSVPLEPGLTHDLGALQLEPR